MSLRTYFIFFLLCILASMPAYGQLVADFNFEDPNDLLKNSANEDVPALAINPFARVADGGVYTVADPSNPDNHQNIDLEVPLSLVEGLNTIYMEWEFRCQEESSWLYRAGSNLSSGIFHSATQGFNIRYYTRTEPDAEPVFIHTNFQDPLIPPMHRGRRVKVAFYYNQDEGIARFYMDNQEIWKSTDHGFPATPGAELYWMSDDDFLTIASGTNGDASTIPSLYRFRIFEEACSEPTTPEIVENETALDICIGESATLVANAENVEGGEYQWYSGSADRLTRIEGATTATFQTDAINTPGQYSYFVTFSNGPCESEPVEVVITVHDRPDTPEIVNIPSSCGPGTFNLRVSGGQEGYYRWYRTNPTSDPMAIAIPEETGSTFTTEELNASHTFYVTTLGELGCESLPAEIKAEVHKIPPKPNVQEVPPLCETDLREIEINVLVGESSYSYNWYADAGRTRLIQENTGPSITYDVKQTTTLYVTASNGNCESLEQEEVRIEVVETPEMDAGEDVTILRGESVRLMASGDVRNYHWEPRLGLDSDQSMDPTASPPYTITYVVSGTNEGGCEVMDSVTVHVIKEFPVPNAFTPNQDGINDYWEIPGSSNSNDQFQSIDIQYPNCRIAVFNRWGNQVFYSEGYSDPWDGTSNGQKLEPGTYYYTLDLGNGEAPQKGTITIMP